MRLHQKQLIIFQALGPAAILSLKSCSNYLTGLSRFSVLGRAFVIANDSNGMACTMLLIQASHHRTADGSIRAGPLGGAWLEAACEPTAEFRRYRHDICDEHLTKPDGAIRRPELLRPGAGSGAPWRWDIYHDASYPGNKSIATPPI